MRKDIFSSEGPLPGSPKEASYSIDALVVGAGFSGCYMLHKLRSAGFSVKIVESGSGFGGVWHWNCYPGARVDSPVPIYEYDIPEIWQSWSWPEMFPSGSQIQEYFNHVDKVLNLKKDTIFNTTIVSAVFDQEKKKWLATSRNGQTFEAQHLVLSTGFAAKRSFPDWPGLDKFEGEVHHSSFWPSGGVDLAGKKVGIIGTGSTGLQIAQTISDSVEKLVVFQRTPNLALPLLQEKLAKEADEERRLAYPEQLKQRLSTFAGYPYDNVDRNTFDDTAEQREVFFEDLWNKGGFYFWLATYKDILSDKKANDEAYNFWCKKVRSRISDPATAEILAPKIPPHPFGTKRPALEWKWYDIFNQPQVHLVDLQNNPVDHVEKTGIVTKDGILHKLDVISLATGFDAITGGLKAIDIRSISGQSLSQKWDDGVQTALGMLVADFPNMFILYGPQGPTAFSNGPSCVEVQGNWVTSLLNDMRARGAHTINPTPDSEERWTSLIEEITSKTLFPLADSWYMGANIPGKPRQMLNYTGGLPKYAKELQEARVGGYKEFKIEP